MNNPSDPKEIEDVWQDPRHDFDAQHCRIGEPNDIGGDRIPMTDFELQRSVNLTQKSEPGWTLCNLNINNCGICVSLVGLTREDLRTLIRFLADYKQRMRNF